MLRSIFTPLLLLTSLHTAIDTAVAQEPESLQPLAKEVQLFDGSDLKQWLLSLIHI